eukprot:275244-Amphidinium_carterae.1
MHGMLLCLGVSVQRFLVGKLHHKGRRQGFGFRIQFAINPPGQDIEHDNGHVHYVQPRFEKVLNMTAAMLNMCIEPPSQPLPPPSPICSVPQGSLTPPIKERAAMFNTLHKRG